jgi:hypothetical protein
LHVGHERQHVGSAPRRHAIRTLFEQRSGAPVLRPGNELDVDLDPTVGTGCVPQEGVGSVLTETVSTFPDPDSERIGQDECALAGLEPRFEHEAAVDVPTGGPTHVAYRDPEVAGVVSSTRPKTLGESNRGNTSHSTVPSAATRAAEWQSDRKA